ncbi:phospholipase D family protein [Oleiagrimonas sp. MCCC 1A03011]|uniref:phospholipase D family protein n=1 Tax=Oleiagrimonas sp. MCCC 1A03011 TaxID=1926883 RepID=UPI000DC4068B|nr:phospholipase D family protein [Oleiagrimonas sp. MCCC 1A03011]RAP57897.1 hypothetical protein BTJ49_08515 [Oleiagrimonas sp. MCCC 1A03011]
MKVIDADSTLKDQIKDISNAHIRIVTAYVTDVLETLQELVSRNCRVEIIVGTIDCFNHPKHLAQIGVLPGIDLHVDFRRQNSVHWKLYLLEPFDVIIGSPNFTGRGLKTSRDIAVSFSDQTMFVEFKQRINVLLKAPRVIKFGTAAYQREMAQYEADFEIEQRHRRSAIADGSTPSVSDWLADERNQELKLYVWEDHHQEPEKQRAREMAVKGRKAAAMPESEKSPIREFFTTSQKRTPLKAGDIVLCCRTSGAYMDFFRLDLIERGGDGLLYMIDMKSSKPARLFNLSEAKARLAGYVQDNELVGPVTITRSELLDLFNISA